MSYKVQIDIKKINENFSIYDSITTYLFDENSMNAKASNFTRYIEKLNYPNAKSDTPKNRTRIIKSTYYNRRDLMNDGYESYINSQKNLNFNSLSVIEEAFYFRLTNYLEKCLLNKDANTPQLPFLKNIKVTKNFFPLYVALIYSITNIKDWDSMIDDIKFFSKFIVKTSNNSGKRFISLSTENALKYYDYWLNLLIPKETYLLITNAEKILQKETNQVLKRFLKYNLTLFIDPIAKSFFKSTHIQEKFLSHASSILDDFSRRQKHTLSNNSSETMLKGCIGENLRIDIDYYKKLDDYIYSKYVTEKQGNNNSNI